MSGRLGNRNTGRSHATMDMRTIERIEYGSASAVRVLPAAISDLGMLEKFIAFDTETTGLDPEKDGIVELGAVVFEHGVPTETFQSYVNAGIRISEEVSALNHITNEMLQAAPTEEIIYPELMRFLGTAAKGETMICGHVAAFDLSFLCKTLGWLGITANFRFVDTRQLATQIPELTHHSLAAVAEYFNVPHEHAHQAKEDALTSGQIFCKMLERNRNV